MQKEMKYQPGRDITFIQIKAYIHLKNRLLFQNMDLFLSCVLLIHLICIFSLILSFLSYFPLFHGHYHEPPVDWRLSLLWELRIRQVYSSLKFKHSQVVKAQCIKCKVRLCQEFRDIRNHRGRHEVKVKCEWMKRLILWEDKWLKSCWGNGVRTMGKSDAIGAERYL